MTGGSDAVREEALLLNGNTCHRLSFQRHNSVVTRDAPGDPGQLQMCPVPACPRLWDVQVTGPPPERDASLWDQCREPSAGHLRGVCDGRARRGLDLRPQVGRACLSRWPGPNPVTGRGGHCALTQHGLSHCAARRWTWGQQ